MNLTELERFYKAALSPTFGEQLYIIHERDDFAHIVLDGRQEEFFFTLYGTDHLRLYWCNECFIFDSRRNSLVSSDTFGEIVFEGKVDAALLPPLIIGLLLQLKDCTFLSKEEVIRGKIPSGYDDIKDYIIYAKANIAPKPPYRLANILILYK